MMRWPVLMLAAALSVGVPAQEARWGRLGAPPEGVTKHADIAWTQIEGVDASRLSLDLYAPDDAEDAPIMLYVHGGGWAHGDKAAVARKPEFLCSAGWLFASTNYRLVPEVTPAEQAHDIARAVAWLHERAAQYGGDPERIFLMGHSAGAHLVALVSTWPAPLEEAGLSLGALSGTIVVDGAGIDLESHMANVGRLKFFADAFGDDPQRWRELSPLAHVAPDVDIPPMLILVQGSVRRVAHSRGFTDALIDCGVEAEMLHLPDHTHASINRSIGEPGDPTTEAVAAFLSGRGERMSAED